MPRALYDVHQRFLQLTAETGHTTGGPPQRARIVSPRFAASFAASTLFLVVRGRTPATNHQVHITVGDQAIGQRKARINGNGASEQRQCEVDRFVRGRMGGERPQIKIVGG